MNFDEAIPSFPMGDMVPYQALTEIPTHDGRICYSCGSRLSRYNADKRCSPCRDTEKQITIEVLDNLLS